jgi:O-antigen ligase
MRQLSRFLSVKTALLFLLFLAMTISYRADVEGLSFALIEPIALLVSALLWVNRITSGRQLVFLKDPLVFIFASITLWSIVIRPWSPDWRHGLSDVRDWVIPTLLFITLVSNIRLKWRHYINLFLAVEIGLMILGLYQVKTDSFRPFLAPEAAYKRGFYSQFNNSPVSSFAVGFFGHPGVFAEYLFVGLLILIALSWQRWKWLRALLVFGFIGAIFYTFSKTVLGSLPFALLLFGVLTRSSRHFWTRVLFCLIVSGLLITGLLLVMRKSGSITLDFGTFVWRIEQWQAGLSLLMLYPTVFLNGNGVDIGILEGLLQGNPHNIYIFMLLQYGLMGLMLILALVAAVFWQGFRAYKWGWMKQEPLLAGLWVALVGLLVFGLFGTSLSYVEFRSIFAVVASLFIGLWHEKRWENRCGHGTA